MTCDIGFPDYETRVAIIKTKLQERGANFSEEIIDLIGKRVQRNIREIEGILTKMIFHETNFNKPLDATTADKIISELIDRPATNINPNQVISAVAKFFETSTTDIIGKARNKELIEPRQVTVYLLREMLNMSYPFIAKKIGNRDHTTAIYSYRKVVADLVKNAQLSQKIASIKEELSKLGASQ
jgi:chromosomal replication initiator protein